MQDALRAQYGTFRAFSDKQMDEALQTACSNGLIAENRLEMDSSGNLIIYYKSDQEMIDTIRKYVD